MLPPTNELFTNGTLAEGPFGSSNNIASSTPPLLDLLASNHDFQPGLEEFLAKHPHHEVLKEVLEAVCRLTCRACAILCTSILSEKYSTNEVINSLQSRAVGVLELEAPEHDVVHGSMSEEDANCIIDYLRAFDYVYQRRHPEEQIDQRALSSLATIGYLATRRQLERNHPSSLFYTDQILHELILPMLKTVYQSCTDREYS